jgi:hypothetical protein
MVTFVLLFALVCWILGNDSYNGLFDFRMHEEGAFGAFVIPIAVPSFQFILSILMLGESERDVERH